jgi:hypothetical protein
MNEYLIAFYGWVFFNAILLGLAKDKDDLKRKPFNVRNWWDYHWDNILITGFGIPVVVWFTEELWVLIVNGWFGKDYPYSELALLGAVPLVQLLYYMIRKFSR